MDRVRKQLHMDAVYEMGLTGRNVNVCVLDTGIFPHKDFEDRLIKFVDFTGKRKGGCYDESGHGTHVCGILAGSGRASGGKYQGIAPEAGLIVGKILNRQGKGQTEDLFHALDWILDYHMQYGIRIVNISIGIAEKEERADDVKKRMLLHSYIERFYREGILVVTAAGNFGPAQNSLSVLGESTQTICVGCHDGNVSFSGRKKCEIFSGRGPSIYSLRKPDVVAPGTEIASCSNKSAVGYIRKSGTSMACPIVSGLAALMLERYPTIGVERLMTKIRNGTIDLKEAWSKQGYGMVDGEKLFQQTGP
ncbi:MAG: S8 family serine peptidase [Lachnospiraceae bacterium]